jgi:PAS domain S-box-containing protein
MQVDRHVRTIYTVRVVSFIGCFLVVLLHAWERGFAATVWVAATVHFLAYPHFAYLRSAHARDQRAAELKNLYADSFLLGIWIPVLHFPVWIMYPLVFAPALNGMVNRGLPGFALSLGASTAGIVTGVLIAGYAWWPSTGVLVTTLCFLGSLAYGAGVGYVVYRQAQRMAANRELLRESERRYRLIAEHAGDLVAMVDRDGRWLYNSPSFVRLLSATDLSIGADAFRNLHEDDQFRVRGAVQVVVRSGESCRLRMRLHTTSGEVRRFEALVHPVRGEEADLPAGERGAILGAVIAARDVTELRDREEQLEVAAHAFERMAEAMMITNAAGRILMVNQSYARITGYMPADVVGHAEVDYRTAMQPESFYDEIYAEVMRSGHWDGTTWCRRRDGTLYHEWRSVSAVRDAEDRVTHYITLFRELDSRGADAKSA